MTQNRILQISVLVIALSFLSIGAPAVDNPPKVFITDSKSWEMSGGFGGTSDGFGGHVSGGARPQTAEIVKTFGERCPDVTINMKQDKADYVVVVEHEGGKGLIRKDNKVAVFDNHSGDSIYSHSTTTLGGSVKDACAAVRKHWAEKGAAQAEAERLAQVQWAATAAGTFATEKTPGPSGSKVQVVSTPTGADIEIDGNFVGNTPSFVSLTAGDHSVSVKKSGYNDWSRKIKVTGGEINLSAELEKNVAPPNAPKAEAPSHPVAEVASAAKSLTLQSLGLAGDARSMYGFTITVVAPGSPADRASIQAGDYIVSVNGKTVRTADEVLAAIPAGSKKCTVTISKPYWNSLHSEQRELTLGD